MTNFKKVQYYLLLIAFVSIIVNACKKDEAPIIKVNPVITWTNPANITFGTLLNATQLNATANVQGTYVYTPALGTKLDFGENQELKVDFVPTDTVTYNAISKIVKINVDQFGTMTDQAGNVYKTICIGTQTWMAENLRTKKYRNGDNIDSIASAGWDRLTGAYCVYGISSINGLTYGKLYNWYAVGDVRNIAPNGWHVPSDAEWTTLTTYLGGESVAGGKMKEPGLTHWLSDNTGATNESGFTGLPGGNRSGTGVFDYIGFFGCWWSSTFTSISDAKVRVLYYYLESVLSSDGSMNTGYSVRCIKD
jgi:uncharacterized protein (TIGR02145 family)